MSRVPAALGLRSGPDDTLLADLSGDQFVVDPRSVQTLGGGLLFTCRRAAGRCLVVSGDDPACDLLSRFHGEAAILGLPGTTSSARLCPLDRSNASAVRGLLAWTRPITLGLDRSFGCGDRLGLANAAHLRALNGSGLRPVLAQQSTRELTRTERVPEAVLDAATWAALREGFSAGYGADADHLKTPAEIDRMADAGFTMFTFDPGDHVAVGLDRLSVSDLASHAARLPWDLLESTLDETTRRYADRHVRVGPGVELQPDGAEVLVAAVKYGRAIAHVARMYRHLAERMGRRPFEVEISVDETDSPTSPFEHYLLSTELHRLGVRWVSLAPRFVGSFEKGIDFRGDLGELRRDLAAHLAVAAACGPYKLSLHSGSDKFSVYREFAALGSPAIHVKTAGTSYLEALRATAICDQPLFREIVDFSTSVFADERRTYHVSADPSAVPDVSAVADGDLPRLLDDDTVRQILHVAFGRVLTDRDSAGHPRFRERLLGCLDANEYVHEACVERHFRRHLAALGSTAEAR